MSEWNKNTYILTTKFIYPLNKTHIQNVGIGAVMGNRKGLLNAFSHALQSEKDASAPADHLR